MLVLARSVLNHTLRALLIVVGIASASRTALGQTCAAIPTTGQHRVAVGFLGEAHAYGSSRLLLVSGRPLRTNRAWLSSSLGRTADSELLLHGYTARLAASFALDLPGRLALCPLLATSWAQADDRITGPGPRITWRDADLGVAVERSWHVGPALSTSAVLRARAGRAHATRTSPASRSEDAHWPYHVFEFFAGIVIDDILVVRPGITHFRYTDGNAFIALEPLARADREVGLSLLVSLLF